MIMKEDRGKWEEVIHSKIHDFEVETQPEDWDALFAALSGGKKSMLIPFRKILFASAASAAVIALLTMAGLYLFTKNDKKPDAQYVIENNEPRKSVGDGEGDDKPAEIIINKPVEDIIAFSGRQQAKTPVKEWTKPEEQPTTSDPLPVDERKAVQIQELEIFVPPQDVDVPNDENEMEMLAEEMILHKSNLAAVSTEAKRRRWGFGVGTGGFAAGSTSGNPGVSTTSRLLRPDEYERDGGQILLRNSLQNATLLDPVDGVELEADSNDGKRKHKTPISGGLGVSYYLTDRLTLQSGAVYTLLRTKGNYYDIASNPAEWKQNLHFLGVPLSASYAIAEWKRVNFYVSAGGMTEWNVAGKIKRTAQVEGLEVIKSERLRMKEPLWSVNSRAGAVYPLWRFVNVYAEAGASYYFDNKSNIETIRSDKPFNVSLQAGIRFGFGK